MARGRLISRTLGSSRKFAALHKHAGELAEFAQGLFMLVVANTDDFGRMSGDAFTVKHAVWPTSLRREEEFEAALAAMHLVRLISRYEAEGQQVLQVVEFEAHQPGLHKRTKSKFPEAVSGNVTEIPSEGKGRELKGREEINSSEPHAASEPVAGSTQEASEPRARAESPVVLAFPTVGAHGATWSLTEEQIASWSQSFPGVDIAAEARKALAWIHAHPDRRKTTKGMAKFLVSWLTRAVDGGNFTRAAAPAVRKVSGEDWYEECGVRHNHECGLDRMRHHTRTLVEQQRATA